MSIDITKKIKFLELPQSSYDNLNIKDSYTFYKTENNMYYEDLLLSYYNKIYNYYIAFYSADDNSLNFCGVDEIPAIGTQLLGKIVTTVYQGLDDTSTSTSTIPWYSNRTNFKSVIVDITFSKYQPSSIGLWFYGFTNLTTVDLSFLDTSQTTIMQSMFYNCSSLTSLDLSFLDTSKVTNISYMFYGCSKLTSLDLSNFDSSQVTTMSSMFYNCTSLVTIYSNDSIFVTTKVTSGTNMFASCSKLVGGNGTVYSSSNVSYTMAHIDTANNPGYFTAKNSNSYSNIFSDNTPAQIQEAVNQGIAANLWSVGDTIAIELNGTVGAYTFDNETYYAFILGFDHNTDLEANGKHSITLQFGKTIDGIDIAFIDNNYDSTGSSAEFRMNTSKTNSGGWNSSYMKQTICPAFYNALPSDWQDIISTITKYTNNTGSSGSTESKITATNDEQIFLLAEYEIFGSRSYANTYEQNYQRQYDYYAAGNNKIKYQHSTTSTACAWWSRSANSSDAVNFCFVSTNGNLGHTSSDYSFGLAPAFAIVESSTSNLSNLSNSNTKKHKIKFLELPQSSYDNLDIKDSYTFYKTENDMYYEDLLLSYDENRIYNYYIAFYSVDDSSLNFCGVDEIPTTGIQLLGKTVTTVYQGLDSTSTSTSTIPWYSDRTNFKSVIIDKSFINAKPTCTAYWFFSFTNCTLIDGLKYLDTSQVVNMVYMFAGCRGLTSLDLSPLDTSQVTTMSGMFQNCNSLISIDISNFNTSKMDAINYMFDGCSNLTSLDISNFDTSIVTAMSCMFCDCSELTTIYSDDSKFVTTAVTSGTNMFTNCSKLVGGNGTTYSSSKVTYTMAHVDTANNPGYFTAKNNSSYSRASNLGYFTAKNNSSYSSIFSDNTPAQIQTAVSQGIAAILGSSTNNLNSSNDNKKHKIKFLELPQSSYDNLDTKDSYTFYKTENDLYYENLLLSYIKFNRVFGNNTPDLIKQAVTEGIAQDLWSVGDSIVIKLNGVVGDLTFDNETYYAFILGFDHNTDLETNGKHSLTLGFGKTANEINIAFIDSNYSSTGSSAGFRMNTSSTNKGGWDSSYMKNTICPAFYNALSSDWQNIVGTITKYTDNTGNSSNTDAGISATDEQIFLLAEYEIFGSRTYANTYEKNYQQQYDYYAAGNSKVKYRHSATSSTCNWWSRSATYDTVGSFCYTHTTGTLSYFYVAQHSSGFAPAFCIVSDN